MNKDNLKYGNVVEIRNGDNRYLVIKNPHPQPHVVKFKHIEYGVYEERKEFPKLTDDEKVILRNIDKEYKWLARNKDFDLYVFTGKPVKKDDYWGCGDKDYCDRMYIFKHLFQFIKWEDEEPYLIEDLLKEQENDK